MLENVLRIFLITVGVVFIYYVFSVVSRSRKESKGENIKVDKGRLYEVYRDKRDYLKELNSIKNKKGNEFTSMDFSENKDDLRLLKLKELRLYTTEYIKCLNTLEDIEELLSEDI